MQTLIGLFLFWVNGHLADSDGHLRDILRLSYEGLYYNLVLDTAITSIYHSQEN